MDKKETFNTVVWLYLIYEGFFMQNEAQQCKWLSVNSNSHTLERKERGCPGLDHDGSGAGAPGSGTQHKGAGTTPCPPGTDTCPQCQDPATESPALP